MKQKPTANQSALFDRLVLELSSAASLTNNPNTISYSRDKSMTTDTTLQDSKFFQSGGISVGTAGPEMSMDTEEQEEHSSTSSYEDCSSSACSCQECQDKEGPNKIQLKLNSDQEERKKLKLEEMPAEDFCNQTNELSNDQPRHLNETDQKINEMNDEVFNELVAYSYLAGLATAQVQKGEGDDTPVDIDLNDTQFIERSLLQYEKWQQSFLNNTVVHENSKPSEMIESQSEDQQKSTFEPENIKEIQEKYQQKQEEEKKKQIDRQMLRMKSYSGQQLTEDEKQQLISEENEQEVDSIIFQHYYKQLALNASESKKGLEQQSAPTSQQDMPKEEKKASTEQKHQGDQLTQSRAEYLASMDKKASGPKRSEKVGDGDSADEPLPPVDEVTRDCLFVQDQLGGSGVNIEDQSTTRHVVHEPSDEMPIMEAKEPVAPKHSFLGLNDDELYQLAEFDDCEGIMQSGFPLSFTKKQWLQAEKKQKMPTDDKTSDLSLDMTSKDQSKNDGIAQNLSTSNFVGLGGKDDEIRNLVDQIEILNGEVEEDMKKDRALLADLQQNNIFASTEFDEEGAAKLLAELTEEEHQFLLRDQPQKQPQKPSKPFKYDLKELAQEIEDQEKMFMERKDLKMMLDIEKNLYKMLQYSSEDDRQAAKADSDGDDEPYAPTSHDVDVIAGLSLKQLETFMIQGDLRRCMCCNQHYVNKDEKNKGNLPRVLFCGDSLCEQCIVKHIQKAPITQGKDKRTNGAACQLICPVCNYKHIFKLTKQGFVVGNDNYIKFLDDRGPVNFFPSSKINEETSIKILNQSLRDSNGQLQLMDNSISIPSSLILRSLPINVELLELIKNERECGEPDQSNIKLRGLYHLVLDGDSNVKPLENSMPLKSDKFPLSQDRIVNFAQSFSPLETEDKPKDFTSKRDLKESAKQQKKLNIQNLQHSQPDEEIKLEEVECAPPEVNTILQRKDDDDEMIKLVTSPTQNNQLVLDPKNQTLQEMLKSLQDNQNKGAQPQDVVNNLADWFLQSKHAILNKGSIKEKYDTDSNEDSDTSNEEIVLDVEGNQLPGKHNKNLLQYKVYQGSSTSSKSTFKHAGTHNIGSSSTQGLPMGNLSPRGAETLLSQSILSSMQQMSDQKSPQSSQAQINKKRKLRERRKLRQLQQQQNVHSSLKKTKYAGPLFGPIEADGTNLNNASAFLIDNRGGEMSSDSAEDLEGEMAFGTQTIKSEAEEYIRQNVSKEILDFEADSKEPAFINIDLSKYREVAQKAGKLMGEADQRSQNNSPNPREPKSSALPQDILQPNLTNNKTLVGNLDIDPAVGYAIQTQIQNSNKEASLARKAEIQQILAQLQKNDDSSFKNPFPIESLDFLQKHDKDHDQEITDLIKQYVETKQTDPVSKENQSDKTNTQDQATEDIFEGDSASKKKARRNKKKQRKKLLSQAQKDSQLMSLKQYGTQISEQNQKDMCTELVLLGEEIIEGDELRFKTVQRDFFNYRSLDAESCAPEVQVSLKGELDCDNVDRNVQKEEDTNLDSTFKPTDLQDLKLSLTCVRCCDGAPVVSQHAPIVGFQQANDGSRSIAFNKQDLNLIKELVESGLLNVSTHICIHCSVNRQSQEFIEEQLANPELKIPDWMTKAEKKNQVFGYTLCLVCAINHKQMHSKLTTAAIQIHQQNEETGLNHLKDIEEGIEQNHQLKPLLPASHFQLLQKWEQKKAYFSNMIDQSARRLFYQATFEEYGLYMTQIMNKIKVYKGENATLISQKHLESNIQERPVVVEPEVKETKKEKNNKKKKGGRNKIKK